MDLTTIGGTFESDVAAEFYAKKRTGFKSHTKSLKIRPDEKKRIDFIKNKKETQRRAQSIGKKKCFGEVKK